MSFERTANLMSLLDVDNTLLDNDRIVADLRHHLEWNSIRRPTSRSSASVTWPTST